MDNGKIIHVLFSFFILTILFIILEGCEIDGSNAPAYIEASKGDYEDSIKLSWDFVIDATSYNVYCAESENGNYSLVENTFFTSTTYDPFRDGYYYYFKVSFIDENGKESDLSEADYGYTAIPVDDYEDNDITYGNSLLVGSLSGMRSIHSDSDTDWFNFNALTGTKYVIRTIYPNNDVYSYTNREGWVPVDTSIYLYSDNGGTPNTLIADDSDSGTPAGYSQIDWTCSIAGTYYIKIIGDKNGSNPSGWYQLLIEKIQ